MDHAELLGLRAWDGGYADSIGYFQDTVQGILF